MASSEQVRPRPDEVFTPSKIPLAATNVYSSRTEPEKKLRRHLRRGNVPVVFGEFGVGKTTVVRRFLRDENLEDRALYVSSASGKDLADVFKSVLEKLNYTVEKEWHKRVTNSEELGARLVAHAKLGSAEEISTVFEVVITSPTSEALLEVMKANQVILVIDELHKSSDQFREDLADFIKACRGDDSGQPGIVLIGTTADPERLVRRDEGIDRFIKGLSVEPLTDGEARFIAVDGFSKLGLQAPEQLIERLVRTAAGAPTIMQGVCLDMAEACLERGDGFVNESDYSSAIQTYLDEHGDRMVGAYSRSIEQTGTRRYRKQILLAMAEIPKDYVNLEDIRAQVEKQLGVEVQVQALSGPLRQLKSGEDSVLQDVQRRDGETVYNLNSFRDPMMKSFIRFLAELESQGIVVAPAGS